MKIRRNNQWIEKTHIGRLLSGELLGGNFPGPGLSLPQRIKKGEESQMQMRQCCSDCTGLARIVSMCAGASCSRLRWRGLVGDLQRRGMFASLYVVPRTLSSTSLSNIAVYAIQLRLRDHVKFSLAGQ